MKKMKLVKLAMISLVIFIIPACNMPFNIREQANNSDKDSIVESTDSNFSSEGVQDVDPVPVGFQEGLGSFDSYQVMIHFNYSDSTGDKKEISNYLEHSALENSSHSVITIITYNPENDEEQSTSTSEIFSIGNVTCQGSDEDWEYDEVTTQEKELMDVLKNLVDFVPLMENPVFIDEENVNGIDCNHFSFQVAGIGDTSGSIANYNQGDYWLAKDGNYIVKYHLDLEVQSAADGSEDVQISNVVADIDLQSVNVPLSFSLPSACVSDKE